MTVDLVTDEHRDWVDWVVRGLAPLVLRDADQRLAVPPPALTDETLYLTDPPARPTSWTDWAAELEASEPVCDTRSVHAHWRAWHYLEWVQEHHPIAGVGIGIHATINAATGVDPYIVEERARETAYRFAALSPTMSVRDRIAIGLIADGETGVTARGAYDLADSILG